MHRAVTRPIIWFVVVLLAGLASCSTQESVDTVPTPPVAPTREGAPPSQREGAPPSQREELEQRVAPVALYPDALLAQIFMASTYPLEVVEAARWVWGASTGHRGPARSRDAAAVLGPQREVPRGLSPGSDHDE